MTKQTGYPSIDKPWLKYYSEEAINAPLPESTMYNYLWEQNKDHLNDVALIYFGRKITYKQLFQMIDRIAAGLMEFGIKAGDIVSLISLNTPEAICTYYALNRIGAVACMEYVTQAPETLAASVKGVHAKMVFILDMFYSKYEKVLLSSSDYVVVLPLSASMGYPVKAAAALKKTKLPKNSRVMKFSTFIKHGTSIVPESGNACHARAIMVSTSGTTGIPKKVVHSSFNINSVVFQYQTSGMAFRRGETYLSMAPLFLAFGITLAIHLPLCVGVTSIICLDPDAKKTIAAFVKHKPNHFLCGDYHMLEMISNSAVQSMDLSFLRTVAIGGESLSPENVRKVNDFLQKHHSSVGLITGYGMTELGATVITEMSSAYRVGSVGIPQPKVNVKTVDTETGTEKTYGEEGELLIHAPGMMLEYWQNQSETKKAIETDNRGKRWIHTGDLGTIDRDGFVYIKGRLKRIYRRLIPATGTINKVFPDYIENTLSKHPYVSHCAVVCIDHESFITVPVAFITVEQSVDMQHLSKLLSQWIANEIGDYNVPVRFVLKETLPLLASGKVDYRALEREVQL